MNKFIDLAGQKFGAWSILSRAENNKRGNACWLCQCVCGAKKVVVGGSLRNGRSTNCGCLNRIDPSRTEKRCCRCQQIKNMSEFSDWALAKDGHYHYCRPCGGVVSRKSQLKRKYNLSLEEYQRMLEVQGGRCGACRLAEAVVVDHNHTTGETRALLCSICNLTIGALQESPEWAEKLAEYLRRYST